MEKKEKKSDLEGLLNSLIEKGWKPFGRNSNKAYYRPEGPDEFYFGENGYGYIYNGRQLVSKESGLWQFVCENGMVEHKGLDIHSWEHTTAEHSDFWFTDGDNYEYFIIESALCDEDKLEDFLLSNIKIDG